MHRRVATWTLVLAVALALGAGATPVHHPVDEAITPDSVDWTLVWQTPVDWLRTLFGASSDSTLSEPGLESPGNSDYNLESTEIDPDEPPTEVGPTMTPDG